MIAATISTFYALAFLLLSSTNAQQIECPKIQPATNNLNTSFYQKYLPGSGAMKNIPIVASSKVSDEAMYRTPHPGMELRANVSELALTHVLAVNDLSPYRDQFLEADYRALLTPPLMMLLAHTEQTLDIPEHSDLQQAFPDTDWNNRARGFAATEVRPATTVGEENLLSLPNDRHLGYCVMVHEFAHTIHQFGFSIAVLLWVDGMGRIPRRITPNIGPERYFDCNNLAGRTNIIDNTIGINTREKLQTYDPQLYALINYVFRDNPWCYQLPAAGLSICKSSSV
ncbi:hypothetical protein BKA69DRAFT_1037491 [Paraphysoderma sedebokerense]|nr:hypothetical protein BKA69DRAFT_1037491 [Paraphysoderma sedebokerense]